MIDTGLASLSVIAAYYKIPIDMRQMERAYVLEAGTVDTVTLVRAAKDLKLKARAYEGVTREGMKNMVYPAIIHMKNGQYIVITGMRGDKMYIIDPSYKMEPMEANVAKVLEDWTGEMILFTRRFSLEEKAKEFINKFGVEKFFFGDDFPMWDIEEELKRFFKIKLTTTEQELILAKNIKNLLNIK